MEIEKIVSTLREKVGQTSLSDKTITDYVNAFKPAEGTEPDEAFFTLHSGILKSMGGNLSHDVASQVNTFKTQWEKDHPTQQQQQQQQQQAENPDMKALLDRIAALEGKKQEPDPALAALSKQLEAINNRFANEQKQVAIKALMEGVSARGAELRVEDNPTWELAIEMVTPEITSETTKEKAEELVKAKYESLIKRLHPGGAKPYGESGGGNEGSEIEKWLKSRMDADKAKAEQRQKLLDSLK